MKKAELEAEVARLREENANLQGQLAAKQAALDSIVHAVLAPKPALPPIQVWPNPCPPNVVQPRNPFAPPFGNDWWVPSITCQGAGAMPMGQWTVVETHAGPMMTAAAQTIACASSTH